MIQRFMSINKLCKPYLFDKPRCSSAGSKATLFRQETKDGVLYHVSTLTMWYRHRCIYKGLCYALTKLRQALKPIYTKSEIQSLYTITMQRHRSFSWNAVTGSLSCVSRSYAKDIKLSLAMHHAASVDDIRRERVQIITH